MTLREFNAILAGHSWLQEKSDRNTAGFVCSIINQCRYPRKGLQQININKMAPRRNLAPLNPFYRAYVGMK